MANSTASRVLTFDEDDVVIGEGVALSVPAAGFLLRAGSAMLDAIVIMLGYVLTLIGLVWMITAWIEATGARIEGAWIMVLSISWGVLWLVIVPIVIETLSNGRSLGKLVFGLRIVRLDGGAITLRHTLVRGLVGAGELYLSGGAIAVITGLLTRRSQRVGDLLAGTYAQYERAPKPQPLGLVLPPQLQRWATLADVSKLPDRLARRIRDYFLQAPRLDPAARMRLSGALAREAKAYVHPVPDVDAETFLAGVSVMRRDREWRGLQNREQRLTKVAPAFDRLPHGFPDRG